MYNRLSDYRFVRTQNKILQQPEYKTDQINRLNNAPHLLLILHLFHDLSFLIFIIMNAKYHVQLFFSIPLLPRYKKRMLCCKYDIKGSTYFGATKKAQPSDFYLTKPFPVSFPLRKPESFYCVTYSF